MIKRSISCSVAYLNYNREKVDNLQHEKSVTGFDDLTKNIKKYQIKMKQVLLYFIL
jgi:hypothetical protein